MKKLVKIIGYLLIASGVIFTLIFTYVLLYSGDIVSSIIALFLLGFLPLVIGYILIKKAIFFQNNKD